MGFFDSIFKNTKQQEGNSGENNIRAQFKDRKYFESELKRINKWIDQDKEDDDVQLAKGEQLQPFQYRSSFGIREDKADVLYALMEPVNNVKIVFQEALDNFLKSWEDPYEPYAELLEVISKSILLNIDDDRFNLLIDFADKADHQKLSESWKPDALIGYLLNYKKPSRPIPTEIYVPEIYQDLYNVIQAPVSEAPEQMKKYLKSWYPKNKNAPWYNTHLREWGYKGYWCWEAGAVTKIMGLDDSSYKDSPYYPYDMVHWKD